MGGGGRLTKYVFSVTDMWGESVNGRERQFFNYTKQLIVWDADNVKKTLCDIRNVGKMLQNVVNVGTSVTECS